MTWGRSMAKALGAGPRGALTSAGGANLGTEEAAEALRERFLPDAAKTRGAWGRPRTGLSPRQPDRPGRGRGVFERREGRGRCSPLRASPRPPQPPGPWAGRRMSPCREGPLWSVQVPGGGGPTPPLRGQQLLCVPGSALSSPIQKNTLPGAEPGDHRYSSGGRPVLAVPLRIRAVCLPAALTPRTTGAPLPEQGREGLRMPWSLPATHVTVDLSVTLQSVTLAWPGGQATKPEVCRLPRSP